MLTHEAEIMSEHFTHTYLSECMLHAIAEGLPWLATLYLLATMKRLRRLGLIDKHGERP